MPASYSARTARIVSRTAVEIDPATVGRLYRELDNFVGIKETTKDFEHFSRVMHLAGKDLLVHQQVADRSAAPADPVPDARRVRAREPLAHPKAHGHGRIEMSAGGGGVGGGGLARGVRTEDH